MATKATTSSRIPTPATAALRLCAVGGLLATLLTPLGACANAHSEKQADLHAQTAPAGALVTKRPLDLLIVGQGYFPVLLEDSQGASSFAYTRLGSFTLNGDGEVVMASEQAARLAPLVQIPPVAVEVWIDFHGLVSYRLAGEGETVLAAQMQIATFHNPAGLKHVGNALYAETPESGAPDIGDPGTANRGTLMQNYLETSNLDQSRVASTMRPRT